MQTCRQCNGRLRDDQAVDSIITSGICPQCADKLFNRQGEKLKQFLDSFDSPLLLMQADPRQVLTANRLACEMFDKSLSQIEGERGGQVFDCVHSFTEAGCGKDENCEDCKIKNSVVETFAKGSSYERIATVLDIKKNGAIEPFTMQVSTEKVGTFALIRIDTYQTNN